MEYIGTAKVRHFKALSLDGLEICYFPTAFYPVVDIRPHEVFGTVYLVKLLSGLTIVPQGAVLEYIPSQEHPNDHPRFGAVGDN